MTFKQKMVSNLVQLYPSRWRREYGEELRAVLLSQSLGLGVVWDVVLHAARENARYPDPWVFGILFMLAWRVLWILLQPAAWLAAAAGRIDPWIFYVTLAAVSSWSVVRESGLADRVARANLSALFAATTGHIASASMYLTLRAHGLLPHVHFPPIPAILESFSCGSAAILLAELTGLGAGLAGRYIKRKIA